MRNKQERTLNVTVDELDLEAEQNRARQSRSNSDPAAAGGAGRGGFGLTLAEPDAADGAPAADAVGPVRRGHHRRRSGQRSVGRRACGRATSSCRSTAGRSSNAAEAGRELQQVRVGPHRADAASGASDGEVFVTGQEGLAGRLLIAIADCDIADLIRERGPLTVAAFMDLALYDPEFGYYARAAQRSGRAGDFFTSVDVGPLFGELLEIQIAEMAGARSRLCRSSVPTASSSVSIWSKPAPGTAALPPTSCARATQRASRPAPARAAHLVEASAAARAAQRGDARRDLAIGRSRRRDALPDVVRGRAHRQRAARRVAGAPGRHARRRPARGVRRTGRADSGADRAQVRLHSGSRGPAVDARTRRVSRAARHVELEPGWRVEINLGAVDWIRDVARRLRRGFVILIDYGHEARELYSASHAAGTLTTFTRHTMARPIAARDRPGVARASRRSGHHRARRLHQRPRGGRGRRADDARLPRSDLFRPRPARRGRRTARNWDSGSGWR